MSLTFTLPGLQTQLQLVATAIDGSDYATALAELAKADLLMAGLPQETATDGAVLKMRKDLDSARAAVLEAQGSSSANDRRRRIRYGIAYPGHPGG